MVKKVILIIIIIILAGGCKPSLSTPVEQTQSMPSETQDTHAKPIDLPPANSDSNNTYPLVTPTSSEAMTYPIKTPTINLPPGATMAPDFNFDEPLKADAKVVTGIGPAGVPIVLVDMFDPDKIWGTTTIDSNGKFEFVLNEPLIAGGQLAIRLGDLEGTNLNPSDFIYNPNYRDRYLLGVLFDIVVVED
ncbi:MAG: Ig-like domain-containing protein [Anaerolineaceae bacterium]|jgi:hypothetical protein